MAGFVWASPHWLISLSKPTGKYFPASLYQLQHPGQFVMTIELDFPEISYERSSGWRPLSSA